MSDHDNTASPTMTHTAKTATENRHPTVPATKSPRLIGRSLSRATGETGTKAMSDQTRLRLSWLEGALFLALWVVWLLGR